MYDRNGNPALSALAESGEILPVSRENPLYIKLVNEDGSHFNGGGGSTNLTPEQTEALKSAENLTKILGTKQITDEIIEVFSVAPTATGLAPSNLGGGPFIPNGFNLYQGKEITEFGLNIHTPGTLTFVKIRNGETQFEIIQEFVHNFTATGIQWIPSKFGMIGENEFVGVGKVGAGDTARFYYGGVGIGFVSAHMNTKANVNEFSGSGSLNLGMRVKQPAREENVLENLTNSANLGHILKGKKIAVTGDSITTDASVTAGNAIYYDATREQHGVLTPSDQWHGQLAMLTGSKIIANDAWSGSRVSGTNASALCQARATKLPIDADIILIMIGTNDLSGNVPLGEFTPDKAEDTLNPAEITDAYCLMLEKMMKKNGNARIICLSPLRRYSAVGQTWKNTASVTIEALSERIKTIASHYGVDYIDMSGVGFNKRNYRQFMADGLHPNKLGMKRIAEYLAGKLN